MKKCLALALALILCLALALPALAADGSAVVSPQNLAVDGKAATCEKYNINGSNYFKLRDMAALLRGTKAQFSIDFYPETNTVAIIRGREYELLGTELKASADNSATCVPSVWKLTVDGESVEVSTYNIGGSNFYKLRDMGDVVGFAVDFDPSTNTALIYSDAERTAVASGAPFFENFNFSAPAEQHPAATWFIGNSHDAEGGDLTCSAPVITRSAPDGLGNVTWKITYSTKGRIEFPTPKEHKSFGDYGCSFSSYGVYDYYTGAKFNSRMLTNYDRFDYDTLLSIQGKTYKINYNESLTPNGKDERSYYTVILRSDNAHVLEIEAPEDYDGLVLAIRRGETSYRYITWDEYVSGLPADSDSGIRRLSVWNDFDRLNDWVFIRLADYA